MNAIVSSSTARASLGSRAPSHTRVEGPRDTPYADDAAAPKPRQEPEREPGRREVVHGERGLEAVFGVHGRPDQLQPGVVHERVERLVPGVHEPHDGAHVREVESDDTRRPSKGSRERFTRDDVTHGEHQVDIRDLVERSRHGEAESTCRAREEDGLHLR